MDILLIEDDAPFRLLCSEALKAEGFSVRECSSLAQARAQLEQEKPGFVLLDISLPDGNSLELIRQMKGASPIEIPLIFFTGKDDQATRLECFRLGASDYMKKPFVMEELIARIRVHLEIKRSREHAIKLGDEMKEAMKRREKMHQNMAELVVHDLKAPIASIKGMLDLIGRQQLVDEKESERFNQIGGMADFMLLMLTDLLDIGRAQRVGLTLNPVKVDLSQMAFSLRKFFAGHCEVNGIRLEFRLAEGFNFIETDQNLLFRILANLLSNAIRVSKPGQSVEVESAVGQGQRVRFSVLDRGPGVPDDQKQRIFEKFVTTSVPASREEGGTGIGLSFCRLAAESLRGKVWVEDRPGGGSRFSLEFPAAILDSEKLGC